MAEKRPRHPKCDSSSVGRAAASQAAGRGFEPRLSLKNKRKKGGFSLKTSFLFSYEHQHDTCFYVKCVDFFVDIK